MSSSTSTGAFHTFQFTTSFSTNDNDGLPSYSQLFTDSPPSGQSSYNIIFGTETSLSFEYNDEYSFLIRDGFGCLQAKGEVDDYNVTLQNVNGTEMLRISGRIEEADVYRFQVNCKNKNIGSVRVRQKGSPETSLQINANDAFPEMIVRSLQLGDFAIYRPNSMMRPLCNIQLPYVDCYNSKEFDGTIIYHPETGISTEEQLLSVAAAIAFKVTMKRKTAQDETESSVIGYGLGIIVTIVIIILIVALINYMEKRSCERRKASGYAGYANRDC